MTGSVADSHRTSTNGQHREQSPALSASRRSISLRTRPTSTTLPQPEEDPDEAAKRREESAVSGRNLRHWRKTGVPPEGFVSAPPDGKFAWLVLLGACLAGFTAVSLNVIVSVLMEELIVIFSTSTSTISWSISICSGAGSVIAPIATAVINFYSCRRSLMIGGTLFTVGLIAASFATSVEIFLGMFVMMAVGNSFCFTPLPVILSQYFRKYYGIAFGCLTSFYALSKLVLTPLFQMISAQYGAQGTLLIAGGFMLHILVGASLFQPARWHQVLIPTFQDKNMATVSDSKTVPDNTADNVRAKEPIDDASKNGNGFAKEPIDGAINNRSVQSIQNGDNEKETKERNNFLIVSGKRGDERSGHSPNNNENGGSRVGPEKDGVDRNDVTTDCNLEQQPFLTKSHTEVNMADNHHMLAARLLERHGSVPAFNLASSMDLFHAVSVEAVCNPPPLLAPEEESGAVKSTGCLTLFVSGLRGFCGSVDHSLWKESVFHLICVHSIFSIGTMIYGSLYMYPFGVDAGLLPVQSAALVSSRSLGELFGRLLGPVAVTALKLDPRYSFIVITILHGISLLVLTYMSGITGLLAVAGLAGILFGAAVGLTMVLIIDCVGVKRLASTLGLTAFVYSPFMLALGPILGAIKDSTGTYRSCIVILAVMQFLNAILWLCKPLIVRKKPTEQN